MHNDMQVDAALCADWRDGGEANRGELETREKGWTDDLNFSL